jgi:hypothetical protein
VTALFGLDGLDDLVEERPQRLAMAQVQSRQLVLRVGSAAVSDRPACPAQAPRTAAHGRGAAPG